MRLLRHVVSAHKFIKLLLLLLFVVVVVVIITKIKAKEGEYAF